MREDEANTCITQVELFSENTQLQFFISFISFFHIYRDIQ